MWLFKKPKKEKTFVTTSDNTLGFFKEDYKCHYISGGNVCWFLTVSFSCSPYVISVDYPTQEQRKIALKSLVEIVK